MDNVALNAKHQAQVAQSNATGTGTQKNTNGNGPAFSSFLVFSSDTMNPALTMSTARVSNETVREPNVDKDHGQSYDDEPNAEASSVRNEDNSSERADDANHDRNDDTRETRSDSDDHEPNGERREAQDSGEDTERGETASTDQTNTDEPQEAQQAQGDNGDDQPASEATESTASQNGNSNQVADEAANNALNQGVVAGAQMANNPALNANANAAQANTKTQGAKDNVQTAQAVSSTDANAKGQFSDGWQAAGSQNKNVNPQQAQQQNQAAQNAMQTNNLSAQGEAASAAGQQAADLAKKIGPNQRAQVNVNVTNAADTTTSIPSQNLTNAASVQVNASTTQSNASTNKNGAQQTGNAANGNAQVAGLNAQTQQSQQTQQSNQNQSFQNMVGDVKGAAGAAANKGAAVNQPMSANADVAQANSNTTQQTQQSQQAQEAKQAATHKPHVHTTAKPEEISVEIAKAAKAGNDRISIQLKPADLGRIDVQLDMSGSKVTATIVAERPETLSMLKQDSGQLEKALQEAGLQMGDMNFNLQQQQENPGQKMAGSGNAGGAGNAQSSGPEEEILLASEHLLQQRAERSAARGGVDISA